MHASLCDLDVRRHYHLQMHLIYCGYFHLFFSLLFFSFRFYFSLFSLPLSQFVMEPRRLETVACLEQ